MRILVIDDIINLDRGDNMVMCTECKKNVAVVFISTIENGKQVQKGLCLSCARKKGIGPVNQIIENTGMSDDEIDMLNNQMNDLMKNMSPEMMDEMIENNPELQKDSNGMNIFSNLFSANDSSKENGSMEDNTKRNKTKVLDKKQKEKKKFLEMYGTNINDKAKENKIDRVIGRNKEIERTIQILNRRTKNNPVLVGEPGVGKTAIAEGLALKIINKEVPPKLFDKEIYLLDLTSIVAGTQFRGQFESRMRSLIKEASDAENVILVIDELHNIMGAGEAEGAMNAANILKPALAKGQIQVIGATTLKEYRKHIEKDSALERRFQPVMVDEPSIDETIEILKGIKDYYEDYHKVIIPESIIKTAAVMAERYINDRFLPDKAIDVIDEACSRANLNDIDLNDLEMLRSEYRNVELEKKTAVSADSIEEYKRAAEFKMRESRILQQLQDLESKYKPPVIKFDDIAAVIEAWVNVPVKKLTKIQSEKLVDLEDTLHKSIIGQESAVKAVSKAIRRARSGIKKIEKPASFMFVGPTGVGKTELVKTLAVELFGSTEALIRLDMSEYMEKHTVSKLIGSPPGYVGYDEAGQLTEKIRRKPYSIVLLDEIEKAHFDVYNILLQIMDDGRLTDSHGRVVDFSNAIIIMTSNAGTDKKASQIGFGNEGETAVKAKVMDALKNIFRLEFLNRIDEIVVFDSLSKEELAKIVDLLILEVNKSLEDKGIVIKVTDKTKQVIIDDGYEPMFGARPLRRSIQKLIEDELSEKYLKLDIKDGDEIIVDAKDGKIVFNVNSKILIGE